MNILRIKVGGRGPMGKIGIRLVAWRGKCVTCHVLNSSRHIQVTTLQMSPRPRGKSLITSHHITSHHITLQTKHTPHADDQRMCELINSATRTDKQQLMRLIHCSCVIVTMVAPMFYLRQYRRSLNVTSTL